MKEILSVLTFKMGMIDDISIDEGLPSLLASSGIKLRRRYKRLASAYHVGVLIG
jgi:hypothetical protein